MTEDEIYALLRNDEDFIALKKYDFSLSLLKQKYKEIPVPPKLIAMALHMSEEQIIAEYERIVKKLRLLMIPNPDDIE